jgi:hypothetical protein
MNEAAPLNTMINLEEMHIKKKENDELYFQIQNNK